MPLLLMTGASSNALNISPSNIANFDVNHLTPQSVTVTGGLPPYTASSNNGEVCSVTQGASPNIYPNADSLSGSTDFGFTIASGGPGGATDAEYTGTGSAVGSTKTLKETCSVVMGQTYVASMWFDPSQITNAGTQCILGITDMPNAAVQVVGVVPPSGGTAGRYATSAWTCPTNLAPESDLSSSQTSWTAVGGVTRVDGGGPGGANRLTYVGTGSSSGSAEAFTSGSGLGIINVQNGATYTFSAYLGGRSNVVSGGLVLRIINASGGAALATNILPVSGSDGRQSVSWTNNTGVSQIQLVWIVNSVVTSGQTVYLSQPMLEAKASASGYYISSQNPQVQVFAQLLPSAIVTSGQKFKISQPMLALSTVDPNTYLSPTSVFTVTPIYRGSATITYLDSTP